MLSSFIRFIIIYVYKQTPQKKRFDYAHCLHKLTNNRGHNDLQKMKQKKINKILSK